MGGMILLFGQNTTAQNKKTNSIKNNNPVESSGILAMSLSEAKSLLTIGEYDTYISSQPTTIDYTMYSDFESGDTVGESVYSMALAMCDGGFSVGGDFGGGCESSCSSFSSFG